MKKTLGSAFLVAVVSTSFTTPTVADDGAALPLEILRQGHLIVRGSIGPLDKLVFMIDTGASVTTVDERLVGKMQVDSRSVEARSLFDSGGQYREVVLEKVAFGPVHFDVVEAVVMDHSRLNLGKPVDVIIGLNLLRELEFTIDYRSRRLRFGETAPLEHQAGLLRVAPLALVEVEVDGEALTLMLDSGAGESILFEDRVAHRLEGLAMQSIQRVNHLQGGSYARKVQLREASMADESLGRLTAVLASLPGLEALELDGILALRSLRHNLVHFDFAGGRVSWGD